ncbi:MAG: hypothetical protein PVI53_06490 [Desulfobacteraceae bacterium]
MPRANKLQVLIGAAVLLIGGALVYVVDRAPDQTYFVYSTGLGIGLYNMLPDLFGPLGNFLPAFIHVFAFALITAGVASCGKRGWLIICFSWFLIDAAFEFGQKFSAWTVKYIPGSFAGIPVLENTKGFFLRGTFDVYDLVAMGIGAITAYAVLTATMKWRHTS